jgi:CRISPR-associated exonuclease Cas4
MSQVEGNPHFFEDDLLPVSALADLVFCERRAALHHIEEVWEDNLFTVEGSLLHEKTHREEATESRGDVRIARGLRLHSLRLGLSGKADVVEFHRVKEDANGEGMACHAPTKRGPTTRPAAGSLPGTRSEAIMSPLAPLAPAVALPGVKGLWRPFPVEYKRGILRHEEAFEVQLCAQALCIEEMMDVHVPGGALFYGKTVRRLGIEFDSKLREKTEDAAMRLHALFRERRTPTARYEKKCDKCSLFSLCMPKTTGARRSVKRYLADAASADEDTST